MLERFDAKNKRENVRFGMLATIISSLFAKEGADITKPHEWFEGEKSDEMKAEEVSRVLTSYLSAKLENKKDG